MPRTKEKVEDLAEEGRGLTGALATVLEVAEEKGTVTWSDVSDDISSGQWGRLIETGLLLDADGNGFVIDDPEAVHEALEDSDAAAIDDADDEGSNWTQWDKLAGLGALGMMVGYAVPSIRATVGSTVNLVLGPLLDLGLPFHLVILVVAMLTGLWSTILQDKLMDSELMGKYQARMQDLKERREAAKERGDDAELERIQEEQMDAMGDQLGMFKAQFRPMTWIMLLTIPAFLWMYWMILDQGIGQDAATVIILPLVGTVENWNAAGLGPMPAWIVWYFLCSLGFSQILRKALNVQTSPTG